MIQLGCMLLYLKHVWFFCFNILIREVVCPYLVFKVKRNQGAVTVIGSTFSMNVQVGQTPTFVALPKNVIISSLV